MASHAVRSCFGFSSPRVQGRGSVDGFFKSGGDAGEFRDVVAPFASDGGFAVAGCNAAEEIVDEGGVAGGVGGGEGWRPAGKAGGVGGVGGVLLLEVHEALGCWGGFDAVADFHAAAWYVAEEVPPFWVVGERGVGHTRNEPGDVQQVVDFGKVGIGEGVAGEATEDASRCERAGCKDAFGDFPRGTIVAKEDDAFLGEDGVHEDDDGVRACTV